MFNLGFLPGANKVHTTTVDGTIAALEAAAGMLAVGGVLSVVAYPGHDPGLIEAEAVARWMLALDSGRFEVQRVCAVNRVHPAPVLWLAMRCDVRG